MLLGPVGCTKGTGVEIGVAVSLSSLGQGHWDLRKDDHSYKSIFGKREDAKFRSVLNARTERGQRITIRGHS